MPPSQPNHDPLQQVHELNLLFLTHLQVRVRGEPRLLRLAGRRATAAAPREPGIDRGDRRISARVVRSQARRTYAAIGRSIRCAAATTVRTHALGLTILLCAWTLSRQSVYQARLLLGLEARAIQRLRAMQLSDLQPLAYSRRLLLCAFAGRDWIWSELMSETRPEARQHLALIALQPGLRREWPARRVRLSP